MLKPPREPKYLCQTQEDFFQRQVDYRDDSTTAGTGTLVCLVKENVPWKSLNSMCNENDTNLVIMFILYCEMLQIVIQRKTE